MLNIEGGRFEGVCELSLVTDASDGLFVSFLQNTQGEGGCVSLCAITNSNGENLFLIQGKHAAYIVGVEQVSSLKYERFFANLNCIIDTERDLGILLKYLPIDKNKIDDTRVIRGLVNAPYGVRGGNVKIQSQLKYEDISFPYIRGVIMKGCECLNSVNNYKQILMQKNRTDVYNSIISERYRAVQMYNRSKGNALSEISDVYNSFAEKDRHTIDELYALIQSIATQNKVVNSSVISLQALEVLILKSPSNFEDMAHIFGFNKKYVHNAVVRKILHTFETKPINIKKNKGMEAILDVILTYCSDLSQIDKNLICSKRDICAYLNGNINVDFLKGWKKEVYGTHVVAFMHGKSAISCHGQELLITAK